MSAGAPTLLVTGHSGFVGGALLKRQAELEGAQDWRIATLPPELDINEEAKLAQVLGLERPDYILHLAAQSFVPASFENPRATLEVNLLGTLSLIRAAQQSGFKGRLLYVSSSDVYGVVPPERMPITEEQPVAPRNPYAVSKAAAELLCRQMALTSGLDVVIARPFNHVGPGQDSRFVLSSFARDVALRAAGKLDGPFMTGDLDVSRDFSDVLDVLQAYVAMLVKGVGGRTYNVCSGVGLHLGQTLAGMLERAGVTAELQIDPARLRPNEQKRVVGSHALLTADTGWTPRRPMAATLDSMIADWKEKILL